MWTRNWIQTLHYDLSNNRLFVLSFRMKTILMSTLWVQVSCGPAGSDFYCPSCPPKKWHQKTLNQTPKSSNIFPKLSDPSAKSFASSDHKAYKNQKSSKKIQQGSYLQKKPTSHFNLVRHFFPFCLALLNRMGTYPKVQMGKRRRYGWMHEGSKINSISFYISYDEVGARKKTTKKIVHKHEMENFHFYRV